MLADAAADGMFGSPVRPQTFANIQLKTACLLMLYISIDSGGLAAHVGIQTVVPDSPVQTATASGDPTPSIFGAVPSMAPLTCIYNIIVT